MARSRSPSPLGVLLEEARDVSVRASGVLIDRDSWKRAVGERIAARTEPGRLRNGVLTLYVATPAWAQELSFFTGEILARVAELGLKATQIRFLVRPAAASGAPKSRTPERERARAPLPPELQEKLATISDPALRAAIAEAAASGLARPRPSSERRARGPAAAAGRSAPKDRAPAHSAKPPRRKP